MQVKNIEELAGQNLSQFKVKVLWEVFKIDDDGTYRESVGFLSDETVAKGMEDRANYTKVRKMFVLTDGESGFILERTSIKFLNEIEEKKKVQAAALAKLSPAERSLLGLGNS